MTVPVPPDMQQALAARAARRGVTPEDLVREALAWYLHIEDGFRDELSAWQEVRDEALQLAERTPTCT